MFVVKFINSDCVVKRSFIRMMRDFLLNNSPDIFVNNSCIFNIVKETDNRVVYCYTEDDRTFYIKKYFFSNVFKYMKHIFRYSHGIHGYKKSIRLLNLNVSTATPVVAMSYLFGLRSLVVHEAIPGMDAEEFFINYSKDKNLRLKALRKIGSLIAELFSKGYSHGDMNFGGFIIDHSYEKLSVSLIDVDNITNNPKKQFRDLVNFNAHLFVTAKKAETEMLSNDELKEMFLSMLSIHHFDMDYAVFFKKLNKQTELKLLKWGQKGYIAI